MSEGKPFVLCGINLESGMPIRRCAEEEERFERNGGSYASQEGTHS